MQRAQTTKGTDERGYALVGDEKSINQDNFFYYGMWIPGNGSKIIQKAVFGFGFEQIIWK